jgi:hypothetical protein
LRVWLGRAGHDACRLHPPPTPSSRANRAAPQAKIKALVDSYAQQRSKGK